MTTVAVARWNRAKGLIGFAYSVEPSPRTARPRSVHGEVAWILNHAFAHFLQMKCACSLQNHLCDLAWAFADVGSQPCRNIRRLLRGKRLGQAQRGSSHAKADETEEEQSRPHWFRSPARHTKLQVALAK